jgi:hypothetical protein
MSSITPYEYFYDAQQRRFLEQIVRAFSGFQYQTGMQGGAPKIVLVPCHMALTDQMVANIRANASENAMNTVPMITIWQSGLAGRITDLQNPAHVDQRQVFEREIINGKYGAKTGNTYNVERIMPLPFTMTVQADVWTSNLDQKYQLMEQILVAMYPEFEIQNSDNALDWTAVTICFIEDEIDFSSRTIPIGTASPNDTLDIFTVRLRIPIYLTAPAKVRKLVRIEEIITNVGDRVLDLAGDPTIGTQFQQVIVTPGDHFIMVNGSSITLLNSHGGDRMADNSLPSWSGLFRLYGQFVPTISTLRLYLTSDIEGPFVSGTLQYDSEPNGMLWTIDADTLPANTLLPVQAVIDPLKTFPGQGLPSPTDGTRYMLIHDLGNTSAWGASLTASANDIIQYNAMMTQWTVVFNSKLNPQTQFVLNLYTGRQLHWNGEEWIMSIDNYYSPGHWRISL